MSDGAGRQYRLRKALQVAEDAGDTRGQAPLLYEMGLLQAEYGDTAGAARFYERSLRLYEAFADAQGMAANLHGLAGLALDDEDDGRAVELYRQALALQERGPTLHQLGLLAARAGNAAEAMALFRRALALPGDAAPTLYRMAGLYAGQQDWLLAAEHFARAAAEYEGIGNLERQAHCLLQLARVAFTAENAAGALTNAQQGARLYAGMAQWHEVVRAIAPIADYQPELRRSWLAQAAWIACAMPGMSVECFDVVAALGRLLPCGCQLELTLPGLVVLRLEREAPGRTLRNMAPARAMLELAAANHDLDEAALEAWLAERRGEFWRVYREVLEELAALVHGEWLFDRQEVPRCR